MRRKAERPEKERNWIGEGGKSGRAGPYSEGALDVALPVTTAVAKAVNPQYRAAFAPTG